MKVIFHYQGTLYCIELQANVPVGVLPQSCTPTEKKVAHTVLSLITLFRLALTIQAVCAQLKQGISIFPRCGFRVVLVKGVRILQITCVKKCVLTVKCILPEAKVYLSVKKKNRLEIQMRMHLLHAL